MSEYFGLDAYLDSNESSIVVSEYGDTAELWTESDIVESGVDLDVLNDAYLWCACNRVVRMGDAEIEMNFDRFGEVVSAHCGCRS